MLLLTAENIDNYRYGSYPKVQDIDWKAGALDGLVLGRFPSLRSLDCSNNELTTLSGIEYCWRLLRRLVCSNNRLTSLAGIEQLPKLRILTADHNLFETLVIKSVHLVDKIDCSNNPLVSIRVEGCQRLEVLTCNSCQLVTIPNIQNCPRLYTLSCNNNKLKSLVGLEYGSQPKTLNVNNNELASLVGIEGCQRLEEINLQHNQLTSLHSACPQPYLKCLDCSKNLLTSLDGLVYYPRLSSLRCSGNILESLDCNADCSQLRWLYAFDCALKTLEGIERYSQLYELHCNNNQIRSLEQLVYMRNLSWLSYDGNPLDIQTPQVIRFLDRYQHRYTSGSIYDNNQNVHDVAVQKSVCESVQRLLRDPKPEFSIETIIESGLPEHTVRLLIEYCSDSCIHSVHLLTYQELLSYVWARMCGSEHKAELLKILAEQIGDSECKCFTGRFNRTLSVLVGFDPDIMIEISDTSRIGAIILAIKERMIHYDPHLHKAQALAALIEAGYDAEIIEPWLEAISEP